MLASFVCDCFLGLHCNFLERNIGYMTPREDAIFVFLIKISSRSVDFCSFMAHVPNFPEILQFTKEKSSQDSFPIKFSMETHSTSQIKVQRSSETIRCEFH